MHILLELFGVVRPVMKVGAEKHDAFDMLLPAGVQLGDDMRAGRRKDGEVNIMRDVGDARKRLDPVNCFNMGIDRICSSLESGADEIPENRTAKRARFIIGAENSYSFRPKDSIQVPDRHEGPPV
jgi:hypothetical protein